MENSADPDETARYEPSPGSTLLANVCVLVFRVELHHSADYNFISFGITGLIVICLKMEFCSFIR